MTSENLSLNDPKAQTTAEVVCFGSLSAIKLLVIDEWPERNTGCYCKEQKDLIAADAAMIALMLRGWGVQSGMIGSTLGDDHVGRWIAEELKSSGVLGGVRLTPELPTGLSVLISDSTGARTGLWPSASLEKEILPTLVTADLSLIKGSRLLYVDWYDRDFVLRPMDEAIRLGIPVFLNLEYLHQDPEILTSYAGRATICQAVTDAAQHGDEPPLAVARKLLGAGVQIAIVTLASEGCLVVRDKEIIRVLAPSIEAVDTFGAGGTFSAAFIYGYLQGWNTEEMARFAIAAASIKCTRVGLEPPDIAECKQLAASLKVEYLTDETDIKSGE